MVSPLINRLVHYLWRFCVNETEANFSKFHSQRTGTRHDLDNLHAGIAFAE